MTDAERRALDELAADLRVRAAGLPVDSKWRAWMLRRARTCAAAVMLPPTSALTLLPAPVPVEVLDLPVLASTGRRRRAAATMAVAAVAMSLGIIAKRVDDAAHPNFTLVPAVAHLGTPTPTEAVGVEDGGQDEEAEAAA